MRYQTALHSDGDGPLRSQGFQCKGENGQPGRKTARKIDPLMGYTSSGGHNVPERRGRQQCRDFTKM
jgi:hypothetical protein